MIHMPVRAPSAVAVRPTDVRKLSGFATILGAVGEPPPRLAPTRASAEPLPRFLEAETPERGIKEKEKDEARSGARPRPRSFRQLAAANDAVDLDEPGNATMLFGWLGESLDALGALDPLDGAALEPLDAAIDPLAANREMPAGLAEDLETLDVNISVSPLAPKSEVLSLGKAGDTLHGDASIFDLPTPVTIHPNPATQPPLGAPVPADPIRDDGLLLEFPRPLAPRAPAPATLGLPPVPGVQPAAPGRPGASMTPTGLPISDDESAETPSTFGALLGVGAASPVATAVAPVTAAIAVQAGADAPSEAAARAEAASLQQDAHTAIGNAITVRLDDALGHWEVDVIRRDHLLDLVLRGDAGLHDAVRDSTPVLRDRLARDGVTLNHVAFSDPERSANMRQESASNPEARREEAPPWPRSRSPRAASPAVPAHFTPRGVLDRAV